MTTETAMIVAAITVAFIGFAVTLWWAERQTRGRQGIVVPQPKTARPRSFEPAPRQRVGRDGGPHMWAAIGLRLATLL